MKRETALDLKISAEELKRAIKACADRVQELDREREELALRGATYRQLLQLQGYADIKELSVRFKKMTIVAAAEAVLAETPGGKLHARDIVRALLDGGLKYGGKAPKATLVSSINRSDRFERVEGEPNTWQLRARKSVAAATG